MRRLKASIQEDSLHCTVAAYNTPNKIKKGLILLVGLSVLIAQSWPSAVSFWSIDLSFTNVASAFWEIAGLCLRVSFKFWQPSINAASPYIVIFPVERTWLRCSDAGGNPKLLKLLQSDGDTSPSSELTTAILQTIEAMAVDEVFRLSFRAADGLATIINILSRSENQASVFKLWQVIYPRQQVLKLSYRLSICSTFAITI